MNTHRLNLVHVYETLLSAYGPQHWWPARTPFEVMIGAILTQNTSWRNVERAIANLISNHALEPQAMMTMPDEELAELVRPAGYFRIKTKRLRAFCAFYLEHGQWEKLHLLPTDLLRSRLLKVHGVGPETADSILLYAFDRPVFVVDAYTKRIFHRLGFLTSDSRYDDVQRLFHGHLPADHTLFNEYHALIVEHAKRHCLARPICPACPLLTLCPGAQTNRC